MQSPGLIPPGLGAPSLCHTLYSGYHPKNGGKRPRDTWGFISMEKKNENLELFLSLSELLLFGFADSFSESSLVALSFDDHIYFDICRYIYHTGHCL